MPKVYKQQKYFKKKHEIDGKNNLYSHWIECGFETIDKEELSD